MPSANQSLRLASINIEGDKHLDTVLSFLKKFQPDVVCFQELFESSIQMFERELGMRCVFAPMVNKIPVSDSLNCPTTRFGVGILTRFPVASSSVDCYVGNGNDIPLFYKNFETGHVTTNLVLLSATISYEGTQFTFGTTHFTWTKNGEVTDEQRVNLKKLFNVLDTKSELVLTGDFNAPRGREIFSALATRYKDNIPPECKTSIDKNLHRAGDLQLMVDGLFSTPHYEITEVKFSESVSDHMAITALVKKIA